MIKKWRAVMREINPKTGKKNIWKDHLICYSSHSGEQNICTDHTALDLAKTYLENNDCIRIIIEKGDI